MLGAILWPTGIIIDNYMYVLPYIISAIAGIIMIMEFSKIILTNQMLAKLFTFIGNHTLAILTWHFLSFKLVSFIAIIYYKLPMQTLTSFPIINSFVNNNIWICLYFIIGITLPLILIYIKDLFTNRLVININKI